MSDLISALSYMNIVTTTAVKLEFYERFDKSWKWLLGNEVNTFIDYMVDMQIFLKTHNI